MYLNKLERERESEKNGQEPRTHKARGLQLPFIITKIISQNFKQRFFF